MKIEGSCPTEKTASAKKSGSAPQSGAFGKLLESSETSGAAQTAASSATASVGGIFMLQGESDSERKKRKIAVTRGQEALSLLDQITYALLKGDVSTAHLARLKAVAAHTVESVADPKLAAVLDEIDLRLAVETAKLEKAVESL